MTTPPTFATSKQSADIIKRFKQLYTNLGAADSTQADAASEPILLQHVYSDNIVFRDPLHSIHGLPELRRYMDSMYGNIISCEFVFLGEWVAEADADGKASACIKWDMIFSHKKLANSKQVTVRGISHIRFGERIDYHEDVFDLGAMLYEHIPLLNRIVFWLKSRLGG